MKNEFNNNNILQQITNKSKAKALKEANILLLEAAKELSFLHGCEQEGLSSGQPTPLQWLVAVAYLNKAIEIVDENL